MKLRVMARGSAMVPDIDAANAHNRKAFVGRFLDRSQGETWVEVDAEGTQRQHRQAVWSFHGEAVEIPSYREYVQSVKDGDLWAADEETAKYCGVAYDPHFGKQAE